jgi:pimeloyl-ACP methyl ester carboxylesterase
LLRNSLAALALLTFAGAAQAADRAHSVNSSADAAARLHVVETLPADTTPLEAERAVLFVHGATYPGLSFDLAVPGYNWMDYVAARGFAAYAVDIRGYGSSSRPREMAGPAGEAKPVMRAPEAVRDILDAVDFIRRRTGVTRVNLIGWSWGTVTAGAFAAEYPTMVERLVLYAPVYSLYMPERLKAFHLADPEDESRFNPAIGAYRTVDGAGIRSRWEAQIVPDDKDEWRDTAVAEAWIAALLASDPKSATYEPPALRAPNGVLVDVFEIFSGRPVYDAGRIKAPTLIIRGADDPTATDEDAVGLYTALGSRTKDYTAIAGGSHFISLERKAPALMQAVQSFLESGLGE